MKIFCVQTQNEDMIMAQYSALMKQIPLLYLILSVNSLAVAFTYSHLAPLWLAVYLPVTLSVFCLSRAAFVFFWRQTPTVEAGAALRQLQSTNKLAPILAVAFTVWSLSLYPYGDPYARGQVAFYMALTVIGCIFCLMHLRSAALSVTLIVNVPFVIFFFLTAQLAMNAIAVNLALVSVAMIFVLIVYHRDFTRLVASQRSVLDNQARTQELSDENLRLANLDSLTGLPNRRSFFAQMTRLEAQAMDRGEKLAIGIIDLDGFKPVNDTFGHGTGDIVLAEVARRFASVCETPAGPHEIILSRLGGDEFGILVTGPQVDSALLPLARDIAHFAQIPIEHDGTPSRVGATLGFALLPDNGATAKAVYERADFALYQAKRSQRGQALLFDNVQDEALQSLSAVTHALRGAHLEEELYLVFQPVIDVRQNCVVSFEALARWNSPVLGAVSPATFIPAAERSGMIRSVTKVLLTKALEAAKAWPASIQISFNLSAQDISLSDGFLQILNIVRQSGLDPRRIDFEITETSVSLDLETSTRAVDTLKALGSSISLDDFGTGYSSLSHLHRLSLDKVKVDRSFVAEIATHSSSYKIVKSLSALCQDMGLTCVVEGVETDEQLAILKTLKCHVIQGYLFAKPMPEREIADYLTGFHFHDQPPRLERPQHA